MGIHDGVRPFVSKEVIEECFETAREEYARFQSSKNGLALIPDDEDGVVGIHDGVRPFVSKEVIEECFETAREEYAAIPVYAVTDTLRYIDQHGGGKNVLRSDYRVVQTPQTP